MSDGGTQRIPVHPGWRILLVIVSVGTVAMTVAWFTADQFTGDLSELLIAGPAVAGVFVLVRVWFLRITVDDAGRLIVNGWFRRRAFEPGVVRRIDRAPYIGQYGESRFLSVVAVGVWRQADQDVVEISWTLGLPRAVNRTVRHLRAALEGTGNEGTA